MAYQALYRTWRPMKFSDVVGQDVIVTTILNQLVTGRVPHAYLFCGSRGTGKTTTAKLLARSLNCLTPVDGEPCGTCDACRMLEAETSLDVVEMDAASNNGVDEIRSLRENAQYPPSFGRCKVYIIDEVHMLSGSAFNALLKTLEEPPEHVVFILATTEPQKLPATILSRCQRFDFKRIPARLIAGRLREVCASLRTECEPGALEAIAAAAEGGMRDALSILDMCLSYSSGDLTASTVDMVLGTTDRAFLFAFSDALLSGDAAGACEKIDRVMRDGRDPQVFLQQATGHMRQLLLAKTVGKGVGGLLEIADEDEKKLLDMAAGTDEASILRMTGLLAQAETDMKWSSSPRTVLELYAVKCCRPEREVSVEALTQRIAQLEARIQSGAVAAPARRSAPADGKPAQARPAAQPPKDDQAGYDEALKLLRKREVSLYMMMRKAVFEGVRDGAACVRFEDDLYANVLSTNGRQEIVEGCLSEAFGRETRLRVVTEEKKAAKTVGADAKKRLDQVLDAAGRENVEILDEWDDGST